MFNSLSVLCARRRWLKRLSLGVLPSIAHSNIFKKINFHFDPRDMRGPSFHFGYDLEKGFLNYEQVGKNELLDLVPKGGNFLDVGANIGMFSVYFALKRKDIQLYCFEPDSTVYRCLSKNMEQFEDDRIKIFNCGLGEKSEDKSLYKSELNDGGHSFIAENDHQESEVVQVRVFDEMVESGEVEIPDVIKIDVEGFEYQVLKGMVKSIQKRRPTLYIESDNCDFKDKGPLWKLLSSFEGLYARRAGSQKKMNMQELSEFAHNEVQNNILVSNYFFQHQ